MPLIMHSAWLRSDEPFPSGRLFLWAEDADGSSGYTPLPNGHVPGEISSAVQSRAASQSTPSANGQRTADSDEFDIALPDAAQPRPGTRNGRRRSPKTPSHSAQVPVNQLRVQLLERIPGFVAHELQPDSTTVWLPTVNGQPLTQYQHISIRRMAIDGEPSASGSGTGRQTVLPPTLALWQVTGLSLSATTALTFLNLLDAHVHELGRASNRRAWRRLRLGNDLLFWSNAAKHALEIVVSQNYLPGMVNIAGGTFQAIWQPSLLDERLRGQFEQLIHAMPSICRAYGVSSPLEAPSATSVTEHFVASLVDSAVRQWGRRFATETESGVTSPVTLRSDSAREPSPAHHWIQRLRTPERQLNLPPQPAFHLYRDWQSWLEQLHITSDASVSICFELIEPDTAHVAQESEDDATAPATIDASSTEYSWQLHYYLQSRADRTLRVPARRIWEHGSASLRLQNQRIDRPQERLQAGLNAASRLFAPIARSLENPQPELALLSTEEAYTFLRDIGPLLESNGFGVIVPDWWREQRRPRLGLRLRLFPESDGPHPANSQLQEADGGHTEEVHNLSVGRGHLGFSSLIQFVWELGLGGETLDRAEFDQVAAMQSPLVRIGKRWMELDPAQVAAARRFLAQPDTSGSMSLLQALRVSQSLEDGSGANAASLPQELVLSSTLPLDAVDLGGWLETALARLRHQSSPDLITEPPGFIGELRPYQQRGVGWLAYLRQLGLGACLADDMGLGKGVQTIALLLHIHHQARTAGEETGQALLICPTSVVANWRRELERFAPGLRVLVHHGNSRFASDEFLQAAAAHDFVITSYGTARRDVDLLTQRGWQDLILDEAQNIKNPAAKQTQAIRRIHASNRVALTGTPIENRLAELWSIMQFLNPGYLESQERFHKQYIVPIERYNEDDRVTELRQIIQPFILRRLKSDPAIISDLPEKNEMIVYCSLTAEQQKLYEQVLHAAWQTLDNSAGIQRRGLVLRLLTRLKQICNHPLQYLKHQAGSDQLELGKIQGRSGKLSRLSDMLEEALSAGDHALIFTQFVEMGELIHAHLRTALGVEALFLHGGTPALQRDKMVQLFQSEDGPPIFILSLRAGGYGLNLTRANHVFHFDRWWNPAVENQATDRAFRIGQQRNVQVHKFVTAGTLEERIHDLIESKQALAANIVGSGEEWLTELETNQLRDLLALRSETLEDG